MRLLTCAVMAVLAGVSVTSAPGAQNPSPAAAGAKAPVHAKQVKRLLIQHAMVIVGNGTPAAGPFDILTEDGVISRIGNADAAAGPSPTW